MLNKRKDEKIQVYYAKDIRDEISTVDKYARQFIYGEETFESGGLWANVREMTNTEVVNSGLQIADVNIKFTVNRNRNIDARCKVIYRGKVYDIKSVDNTDFRSREMSFTAVLTSDQTRYEKDLFIDEDDIS